MGINEGKEEKEDYNLEISNILLDEKSLKFPLMKIKIRILTLKTLKIFYQKNLHLNAQNVKM